MSKNKDPAVLFYTADFLASTVLWTYEELGMYIKLLCMQHLQGGISKQDLAQVCSDNERVLSKFELGDDGLYYNQRMYEETVRRKNFCDKQRANRVSQTATKLPPNENQTATKLRPNCDQTATKLPPNSNPRVETETVNNTIAIINTTGNVYSLNKTTTTTTKKYVDMGAREREELEIHIVENFSENGYKSDPHSFIAYHEPRGFVDECGKNILEDIPRYIKQWEAMCTATDSSVSLGVKTKRYADMSEDEKIALEMRIEEIFAKTGCKSDPYDFIAYNKPRGFIGIGGENILEELPKYIDRWERREYERIGREAPERLL